MFEEKGTKEEGAKEGIWVKNAGSEENKRYLSFLAYMEEKREEARQALKEDKDRKEEAKKKEMSWALMREATAYIKDNTDKWRVRRIEEEERIKEEEKRDRLAVVAEKKKRYGLKTLSKEERKRLTLRTSDRIEVARAKENLWRCFRDVELIKEM